MNQSTERLNIPQMCAMFGVTHLTIYHWRKGTATRDALPVAKPTKDEPPNAVRFDKARVLKWAKKHDVAIIASNPKVATSKPRGPKPKKA